MVLSINHILPATNQEAMRQVRTVGVVYPEERMDKIWQVIEKHIVDEYAVATGPGMPNRGYIMGMVASSAYMGSQFVKMRGPTWVRLEEEKEMRNEIMKKECAQSKGPGVSLS